MKDVIVHYLYNNIPRYVKEDYPNFHELIKEYYQLINDIMLDDVLELRANASITEANEYYLEKYIKEKGFKFYDHIKDKRQFALMINDLISYRGSEQAVRYVMKALFNDDVEIEYPRDKLLIPSHTEFSKEYYLYTTASSVDTMKFKEFIERTKDISAEIRGVDSNTITLIESIEVQNDEIIKIGILLPKYDFNLGEDVILSIDDIEIRETLYTIPTIMIDDRGYYYKIGESISITNTSQDGEYLIDTLYSDGVKEIETTLALSDGDIIDTRSEDGGYGFVAKQNGDRLDIYSNGKGYTNPPQFRLNGEPIDDVTVINSNIGGVGKIHYKKPYLIKDISNHDISIDTQDGGGFSGSVKLQTIFEVDQYLDDRSTLNNNSYLVDSDKYQMYSYVIKTDVDEDDFINIVRDYLGRSGYAFFKESKS